ncbi:CHAT domain-containing protein [Pseudanabaena galeata UHCC 0370]|uniref:CHAT domain-containing protein n=1 Tax=Pseudanabaena galeata UHCC 0370 TaxID=3110310 RepID=A0ABU5TFA6_9CYAN|nr:CHAT domain-containing protein [Pseudanabaena galeata]MEA5476751.1 CHAT domain-containing protein [Pseudanabaena galeata UHCC 0370]
MNLRSRYGLSLSAISLVVCPFLVSVVTLPEVVFGAEVQEESSHTSLISGGIINIEEQIKKNNEKIAYYERMLSTYKKAGHQNVQLIALKNLCRLHTSIPKAFEYCKQAIAIAEQIGDLKSKDEMVVSIDDIGWKATGAGDNAYSSLNLAEALKSHHQALEIYKFLNNKYRESYNLAYLGNTYDLLGQHTKALQLLLEALDIAREKNYPGNECLILGFLGELYHYSLRQYSKALEYNQKALSICQELGNMSLASFNLSNMGLAFIELNQPLRALEAFQEALDIESGDNAKSYALYGLGMTYSKLGRLSEAIDTLLQSVSTSRRAENIWVERESLSTIGDLLNQQKQVELSIIFYKEAVNTTEKIRKNLRVLSREEQQTYTKTVENTYRNLADLLLKQDRILEAQQVLDLLKVEELNDYLKNVRANDQTAQGVDLQSPEQNIIAFSNELTSLQQLDTITPAQKQRLSELTNQEINRNEQFNAFLQTPLIQKQLEELRRIEKAENVDIEKFNRLRSNLRKVKNAVILYPLILEDRLELIIITANTPPIRKTTKIKREQLNTAIAGFLSNLRDPSSADVEKDAQQLYEWIIKPFEAELQQANIQTIIYAPDGQLRYIPLAALHDGKQWLVEKYRINNITASSLTDFTPRDYSELPSVLAAAATNSHNIKLGDRTIPFGALPATKTEVEAIATLLPKTTTLIDQQFSKNVTLQEMKRNTIIHLATHGYFAVGRAEDSFIIFGDGDKATLTDIANWSLTNVSLVVLSACETAIGGKLGSGVEILGLGYRIQDAGAGAAIASLWKVSDDGTSELMQKLYKNLSQKNISSSEALRQAQIAMIRSNKKATSSDRANLRIVGTVPSPSVGQLSHPFYWSAFILIGNGF